MFFLGPFSNSLLCGQRTLDRKTKVFRTNNDVSNTWKSCCTVSRAQGSAKPFPSAIFHVFPPANGTPGNATRREASHELQPAVGSAPHRRTLLRHSSFVDAVGPVMISRYGFSIVGSQYLHHGSATRCRPCLVPHRVVHLLRGV